MINPITTVFYNSTHILRGKALSYLPEKVGSACRVRNNRHYYIQSLENSILQGFEYIQPRLDVNSEACNFFGVTSEVGISQNLKHHGQLIYLKTGKIMPSFPRRGIFTIGNRTSIESVKDQIWGPNYQFDELAKSPARMSFLGEFFSSDQISKGTHTIGLVYNPKTRILYCLDSLSNKYNGVKKYQEVLKDIFNSPNGEIEQIIFSNKEQQSMTEYTCNNWAIANIEALTKALRANPEIKTTEELNAVLPNNINRILYEQMLAVKNFGTNYAQYNY